jgi:formylglycine-generating enzyme required for sulfatase activity
MKAKKSKDNTAIIVAVIAALATLITAIIGLAMPFVERMASENTSTPMPLATPTQAPVVAESPAATEAPTLGIGSIIISDGVIMLYVPAGTFSMGSEENDDEKPIHSVDLDAYYIYKYEVTNAAYKRCMDAGACNPPKQSNSSTRSAYYGNPEFDDYPVIYVDWNMANEYCLWRNARLPTEAEWEKAARGVDGRTYPWGEYINCDRVNYYDGSKYCVGDTTKVGSYESGKSPYGVYDMGGNVWEWVNDWYSGTYYRSSPSSNRLGPDSGQYRVLRGGSWSLNPNYVRSANRGWGIPVTLRDVGFRCARGTSP